MSVLARELDAYQRAVDAYQRRVNSYNRGVDAYRGTLVYDQNGRILITGGGIRGVKAVDDDGKIVDASLPQGFDLSMYGGSPVPDSPFTMLRQNHTGTTRESRDDVYRSYDSDTGQETFYYWGEGGGDAGPPRETLSAEWRIDEKIPGFSEGDNWTPDRYVASREVKLYPNQPAEWTETFDMKAPNPTAAAMRRMSTPSLAQMEAGLIGEVIKGGGVKYGVPAYRPKDYGRKTANENGTNGGPSTFRPGPSTSRPLAIL